MAPGGFVSNTPTESCQVRIDSGRQFEPRCVVHRDGVLNEVVTRDGEAFPACGYGVLRIFTGTAESPTSLKEHGYLLLVVTNQPDVTRRNRSAMPPGK